MTFQRSKHFSLNDTYLVVSTVCWPTNYMMANGMFNLKIWLETWKEMRTALFRVITQRVLIISYRRFGTTCRSHTKGSRIQKKGRKLLISCMRVWCIIIMKEMLKMWIGGNMVSRWDFVIAVWRRFVNCLKKWHSLIKSVHHDGGC
jgi:hypothetical protein